MNLARVWVEAKQINALTEVMFGCLSSYLNMVLVRARGVAMLRVASDTGESAGRHVPIAVLQACRSA